MATLIRDRYEPVRLLGRGGQGSVLLARDHQHDRLVAIKVRSAVGEQDRAALLREARVLLDLRPHAGLPLVREDFFEGDDYYLVMDWIEGETLQSIVDRDGPMTLGETLPALNAIAAALDHLHAHEPPVVHRDVKPANVIRTPDHRIVLVDFGIAGQGAAGGGRAGTESFRAPEAAGSGPTGPAADVFGLAATAVALLSGSPPKPGPRPDLAGVGRNDMDRVWAALNSGLAFDPARRPQRAGDLAARLVPPPAPTNLPSLLTAFVGRSEAVGRLAKEIEAARLVTAVGPAGIGKSRLAVEVGAACLRAFPSGVFLVELGPLAGPDLVVKAIAAVLAVVEEPTRDLLDLVCEACVARRLLLVVDNCEHLVDEVARALETILTRCPEVAVLATSRRRLDIAGEIVWTVEPLSLPESEDDIQAAAASAAVALFCDRARLAIPDFELDETNTAAVARICRRLDGLPLAIELAAARTTHLTPAEIAARLDDRFRLLTTGSRTAEPRQRTLEAAIDWSYALLPPDQQRLFADLSMFAAGFTLSAAEAVADPALSGDVIDGLGSLVAGSLVSSTIRGRVTRYRMLETVRVFGRRRLAEADTQDGAVRRYVAWGAATASAAAAELDGPDQAGALRQLDDDHDNLRAALALSVDAAPDMTAELALALSGYWRIHGHWTEGRRWLEAAIDRAGARRPEVLRAAGDLAHEEGELTIAGGLLERARVDVGVEDSPRAAAILASRGRLAESRGDLDVAEELHRACLAMLERAGDRRGVADTLLQLGRVAESRSDLSAARDLHTQGLAAYRETGHSLGVANALIELAYVGQYQGDPVARGLIEESLAIYRQLEHAQGIGRALLLLAIRTFLDGDPVQALALGQESLAIRHRLGDKAGMAVSLEGLGGLASFVGQHERSCRILGAAESLRERLGTPISPSDRSMYDFAVSIARQNLDPERFAALWQQGRTTSLDDVVAEALAPPT